MEGEERPTFDEKRQRLAKRHQRESLALGLLGLILFAAIAWAVLPTEVTHRLAAWAESVSSNPWVVVGLYVLVAYAALTALVLPLRVAGRLSDLRYGLTKQPWTSWALDRLKAMGLGLLFAVVAAEALYWTLRNVGDLWWLAFWGLTLAFTLLVGYLAPVVLLPLFYPVRKVEDPELRNRLERTSERAGIRVLGVYEFRSGAKTERGTAALAGLGGTKRILLSDHILAHFSPEEVEGILAHELAHQVQGDTPLYLGVSSLLSLVGLFLADRFVRLAMPFYGLEDLASVATLPLFVLVGILYHQAVGPFFNALSRRREASADRRGAALCGNPRALATALVKLHDRNLADASPHPAVEALLYSHPAGERRVAALLGEGGRRSSSSY